LTHLCLIRHGQTNWNLEGRYQGQSDISLNSLGREQAYKLTLQLEKYKFSAIFSSDLDRAKETAEIISSQLHVPIYIDPRLREINQGEWEGLRIEEIKKRYKGYFDRLLVDSSEIQLPGGESISEVSKRVNSALNDISKQFPDANIIISSHGLSLATVICSVEGFPLMQAFQKIPANTTPVWVEWN